MVHALTSAKAMYLEKMKLGETVIEVETTCTLSKSQLAAICTSPEGVVFRFSDMIDQYDKFMANVKKHVTNAYSTRGAEQYNLSFMLLDVAVTGLQSPDNSGGLILAGSLVLPSVEGISHPGSHEIGDFRKVLDQDKPRVYALGEEHSFVHTLKHCNVHEVYEVIGLNSKTLPQVRLPNGEIAGQMTSPLVLKARADSSVSVKIRDNVPIPLLHGHLIDNKSAYESALRMSMSKYLRPMPGSAVGTEYHVFLPDACWGRQWYLNHPEYEAEGGVVVPLDVFVADSYNYMEQANTTRITTFERSGICWNAQMLEYPPCVKFILKARFVPIVEKHMDGAVESIPWNSLKVDARKKIPLVDQMDITKNEVLP